MRILEQLAAASAQDVPQWWQIVSSFALMGTFATAVVAAIVGLWTLRQRAQADRRVQIAAAKLRGALDERLNRETPEWVKRLAEQRLAS